MKIAIPIEEIKGTESVIAEHFGKAPYFAIITLKEGEAKIDIHENPALSNHKPGLLPEMLKSLGINILIAKGVGRRAEILLNELGIKVIKGVSGNLKEILNSLIEGNLKGDPNYQPQDKHGECEKH